MYSFAIIPSFGYDTTAGTLVKDEDRGAETQKLILTKDQ